MWAGCCLALAMGPAGWAQGDAKKTPPVGPPVAAAGPDKIMTPAQIRALLGSVDEVLAFAAKDSGLPGSVKFKRKVLGRAEMNAYLRKNFDEDESARRLQRSEIVLKKFGLLSRDFALRPFLLSLLTEQVAGFYDPKAKTVNLLNWVEPDAQKPVLAHELTHALQDGKVGLEVWSANGFKGVSRSAAEDVERVQRDELETARQAVTEGQAMLVFLDYSLKDSGKTLAEVPELADRLKQSTADTTGSPIMARAPLLLQRSLLFPYSDGFGFEDAILLAKGRDAAFAGVLAAPPGSSFEIMHPAAYLAHAVVPVLTMPDVHAVLDKDYEPYDVGVMGELDVEILTRLFGGPEMGSALATEWDGGVYYAAQRRSATAAERGTTGSLALLYLSRWKSEQAAQSFLRVYTAELGRKYTKLVERKGDELDDEQVYTTEEGDVVITLAGTSVFVSEGVPAATARKLGAQFLAVQGRGPVKMADIPRHELTLDVVRGLGAFGVMKVALGR